MKQYFIKRYLKNNRGTSIVIFALALIMITGMAALVLDIGDIAMEKAILSNSVDSAALAAAFELVTNKSNASNIAAEYVKKNDSTLKSVTCTIDPDYRGIQVSATNNVKYYFANVFGFKNKDITSTAKARAENISALAGIRPIAVVQQTFTYGRLYTLKEGGGGGQNGNYAPIDLGGTGAQIYQNNLENGYNGTIRIGDIIYTETGDIAGPTNLAIQRLIGQCSDTYTTYHLNCPRVIFLPVVNTLFVNGKKAIQVLGFATFFLEGVTVAPNGKADVIGRFITYCMDGETSTTASDFGTYSLKLVK